VRVLFVAVEVGTHRLATGQFFNRRRVTFDFGERGARRQTQLPGENVKDTGETDKRRVLSHRAGRKITEVELASFGRRHAGNLTTKTPKRVSHQKAQKAQID
jgi:hypothetical protein